MQKKNKVLVTLTQITMEELDRYIHDFHKDFRGARSFIVDEAVREHIRRKRAGEKESVK